MNTENNNKLIAEFLGYSQPHPDYPNTTYWHKENFSPLTILSFDTDWNWLMEVVEKIESLNYKVIITNHICRIERMILDDIVFSEDIPKKEATYNACVEFIKWYNQQKS